MFWSSQTLRSQKNIITETNFNKNIARLNNMAHKLIGPMGNNLVDKCSTDDQPCIKILEKRKSNLLRKFKEFINVVDYFNRSGIGEQRYKEINQKVKAESTKTN